MTKNAATPETFEDAKKLPGAKVPSEQEFEDFMKNFPDQPMSRRLVNCTVSENEKAKCFESGCYQHQRVVAYCRGGLCQDRVFLPC